MQQQLPPEQGGPPMPDEPQSGNPQSGKQVPGQQMLQSQWIGAAGGPRNLSQMGPPPGTQ
jgi:hypothetical protein